MEKDAELKEIGNEILKENMKYVKAKKEIWITLDDEVKMIDSMNIELIGYCIKLIEKDLKNYRKYLEADVIKKAEDKKRELIDHQDSKIHKCKS